MLSRHLEQVCGTNYIPTDAEVLEIQTFLVQPLSDLANIDEEINIAEQKVCNLRRKRQGLLEGIERYRRLISPLRRLPPDILREIFVRCLAEDRNPTMSAQEAPMLLTRICSQWRTLALATPRLWASLHIPVPNVCPVFEGSYDPKSGERLTLPIVMTVRLAAVKEWIQRSGTLSLNFSIHGYMNHPTDYCKEFIRHILHYRQRWESIKMMCPATSFVELETVPASEFPLLKSLAFSVTHPHDVTTWKEIPIIQASSIQEISFRGIKSRVSQFPLAWSRMTKIRMMESSWSNNSTPSLDEVYHILERCPNLISCEFLINLDGGTERTSFPTIHLPRLESLFIQDDLGARSLYSAIDAPCLRKLRYFGSGGPAVSNGEALNQLLQNVGQSVLELKITSRTFEGEAIFDNLILCPALKTLSIEGANAQTSTNLDEDTATFIDPFLARLTHRSAEDTRCVCPNLEVFECLDDAHFSDDGLFEFILRKQSGVEGQKLAPLKSVTVIFRRQPTMDIHAAIQDRVLPAGLNLKLDIKYPPLSYRSPFSLYEGLVSPVKLDPYRQFILVNDDGEY